MGKLEVLLVLMLKPCETSPLKYPITLQNGDCKSTFTREFPVHRKYKKTSQPEWSSPLSISENPFKLLSFNGIQKNLKKNYVKICPKMRI